MTGPRSSPIATLLQDGKVLLSGGSHSEGDPASAELFDPSSDTFSETASMSVGRYEHTATLLPNGQVLVAGGRVNDNAPSLSSAELYDPTSGTWTSTGSMSVARTGHTATLLNDGRVLITSGLTRDWPNPIQHPVVAEIYDPATGSWTNTGSMAVGRSFHSATLLNDGQVLVVGGSIFGVGPRTGAAEIYNPTSGTFATTNELTTGRSHHAATLLSSGKVLIAAGTTGSNPILGSAELFSPAP